MVAFGPKSPSYVFYVLVYCNFCHLNSHKAQAVPLPFFPPIPHAPFELFVRTPRSDLSGTVDLSTSTTLNDLDSDTKYRLIEQTLTVLEQLVASLEVQLARRTREEHRTQKLSIGSGLLQQLDTLERMMRQERMNRRLDQLKTVKQKLLDLG